MGGREWGAGSARATKGTLVSRRVRHARLPKALHYLRESGSKAVGRSANREAQAYFEQALAPVVDMTSPRAWLTTMRYIQVRSADCPRKRSMVRKTCRKTS